MGRKTREMGWLLEDDRATLESPSLRCGLHLRRPELGLIDLVVDDRRCEALHPLGITCDPASDQGQTQLGPFTDAVVRGADLLVSYQTLRPEELSLRLRWRLLPADEQRTTGLDLSLYAQTDGLQSVPTIVLRSALDLGIRWEPITLVPPALHGSAKPMALPDTNVPIYTAAVAEDRPWLVQMVFPTEFASAKVQSDGLKQVLQYRLFGPHLEKGVIHVGRVRVVWIARDERQRLVEQLYRDFCQSELPLTV
jgi:hypothetical protein